MKSITAILIAAGFVIAVGTAGALGKIESLFLAPYILFSLVTIAVYAHDKSAAQRGKWRTPESHLHLLALLGGWPGALVAQQLFRHKTAKPSFQWIFRITVVLNLALLIWAHTPQGADQLQPLTENFSRLFDSF